MIRPRWVLLFGVAFALAATATVAGAWLRSSPAASMAGDRDHTVDLSTQPPEVVARYRYVEGHPEIARQIPCYCGCGKTLGHRNLLDCFVIGPGKYSSHAAGCKICGDEAMDVERLAADGQDPDAIRAWIDGEYSKYGPGTRTP